MALVSMGIWLVMNAVLSRTMHGTYVAMVDGGGGSSMLSLKSLVLILVLSMVASCHALRTLAMWCYSMPIGSGLVSIFNTSLSILRTRIFVPGAIGLPRLRPRH